MRGAALTVVLSLLSTNVKGPLIKSSHATHSHHSNHNIALLLATQAECAHAGCGSMVRWFGCRPAVGRKDRARMDALRRGLAMANAAHSRRECVVLKPSAALAQA